MALQCILCLWGIIFHITQRSEKLDMFCSKQKGWRNLLLFHTSMFTITLGPQYYSLPNLIWSSPENSLIEWNSLFYETYASLLWYLRRNPDCCTYVYPPFPQLINSYEVLIPSFLRCQYQSNLNEVFGLGVYTEGCILEIASPVFLSAVR